MEVRLLVNSYISVSEGHQLGELANKSIINQFGDVSEVLIHIDPIQHEATKDESLLPERSEVIASLKACWSHLINQHSIASVDLHYLSGTIEVDLVLDVDELSMATARDLETAIEAEPHITKLRIFNKLHESNHDSAAS